MANHNTVLANFLANHSNWHRVQLRKKLNAVFERGDWAGLPTLGFIPDAFQIDEPANVVRLLEVDGHSYTNSEKMFLLADFWYEMDARGWSVELHTIDLFTGANSILTDDKLAKHWFDRYALD